MKTFLSVLLACACMFADAQSITNAPTFTGSIASGDNAYVALVLNGTLRKYHITAINRVRIDSLVTALAGYATSAQLALKVTANSNITAATKAKITYDAKGLVTAGADLVAADIPAIPISGVTNLQTTLDGLVTSSSLTTTLAGYQLAGDYATNTDLLDGLNTKVDAIVDKGLSTNDFTNALKSKLEGVANGATANQTDAYLLTMANHTGYVTSAQIDPALIEDLDMTVVQERSILALRAGGSTIINQTIGMDMLTTNSTQAANVWDGSNRQQPMYFHQRDTIHQLGFEVTTAGSVDLVLDNNTKLGLYKYNGDGTVSLVCSTANIADTHFESIGVKTFNITATVGGGSEYIVTGPGLYFVSLLYNQTSATTPPVLRAGTRGGANQTGGTASNKFHFHTTATDLPSSVTLSSASSSGYSIWIGAYK